MLFMAFSKTECIQLNFNLFSVLHKKTLYKKSKHPIRIIGFVWFLIEKLNFLQHELI